MKPVTRIRYRRLCLLLRLHRLRANMARPINGELKWQRWRNRVTQLEALARTMGAT